MWRSLSFDLPPREVTLPAPFFAPETRAIIDPELGHKRWEIEAKRATNTQMERGMRWFHDWRSTLVLYSSSLHNCVCGSSRRRRPRFHRCGHVRPKFEVLLAAMVAMILAIGFHRTAAVEFAQPISEPEVASNRIKEIAAGAIPDPRILEEYASPTRTGGHFLEELQAVHAEGGVVGAGRDA